MKTRLVLSIILFVGVATISRSYGIENVQTSKINQKIFLELKISKTEVYENEKVPIIIMFFVGGVSVRDIRYPTIKGFGFFVEEYQQPKQYQRVIKGVRYDVVEFKTNIIPQQSGKISLGPAELSCKILYKSPSGNAVKKEQMIVNSQKIVIRVLQSTGDVGVALVCYLIILALIGYLILRIKIYFSAEDREKRGQEEVSLLQEILRKKSEEDRRKWDEEGKKRFFRK